MKALEEYFEKHSDYLRFLESIAAQLNEVTFDGARKIETGDPVVKGGSAVLRILPYKTLPKEGYYMSLRKMGTLKLE